MSRARHRILGTQPEQVRRSEAGERISSVAGIVQEIRDLRTVVGEHIVHTDMAAEITGYAVLCSRSGHCGRMALSFPDYVRVAIVGDMLCGALEYTDRTDLHFAI